MREIFSNWTKKFSRVSQHTLIKGLQSKATANLKTEAQLHLEVLEPRQMLSGVGIGDFLVDFSLDTEAEPSELTLPANAIFSSVDQGTVAAAGDAKINFNDVAVNIDGGAKVTVAIDPFWEEFNGSYRPVYIDTWNPVATSPTIELDTRWDGPLSFELEGGELTATARGSGGRIQGTIGSLGEFDLPLTHIGQWNPYIFDRPIQFIYEADNLRVVLTASEAWGQHYHLEVFVKPDAGEDLGKTQIGYKRSESNHDSENSKRSPGPAGVELHSEREQEDRSEDYLETFTPTGENTFRTDRHVRKRLRHAEKRPRALMKAQRSPVSSTELQEKSDRQEARAQDFPVWIEHEPETPSSDSIKHRSLDNGLKARKWQLRVGKLDTND